MKRSIRATTVRRGFTLLEMVVYIGVLWVFIAVAMPLFTGTLRSWRESDSRQGQEMRFDLAIKQMRRDVWSADSVDAADAHTLKVQGGDGRTIVWRADVSTGALERVEPDAKDSCRWPGLGGLTFAAGGARVTVRTVSGPFPPELSLVSQMMLANGRPR